MITRKMEIRRFFAKNYLGILHTIIEYQEYISNATLSNPNSEMLGLKSWTTATGIDVDQIDSKTYKVCDTNEIIREV
jgi:hypothetical protein